MNFNGDVTKKNIIDNKWWFHFYLIAFKWFGFDYKYEQTTLVSLVWVISCVKNIIG